MYERSRNDVNAVVPPFSNFQIFKLTSSLPLPEIFKAHMKRISVILAVLLILAAAAIYLFKGSKKDSNPDDKPKPISVATNSEPFNQSYAKLLASYYGVKDALVAADTVKANKAALELAMASDSLRLGEIKGDTTGVIKETAKTYTGTISGSATALAGEKDIEAKRKEFEMLSDAVWTLTRTVQYAGEKVYYQFCPMAFDNKGAAWLSNVPEIKNPYFGDKMLTCGSVQDSVDYGKN
jgi:uncharacterized protein YdbL (DUF1318 family)